MEHISPREQAEIEALVGRPQTPMALGGYDGAARFDKQIAGWQPPLRSADAEVLPEKDILDSRARDLGRNDAYVQGGAAIHKDSIVGSFFMLNAKPAWRVLGKTEEWAEDFQAEVEELFTLWAESPMNWVDATRQNNLTDLVRLAVGVYTFTGEALATCEYLRGSGREFRTAVQMVDTDRLSTPPEREYTHLIRGGVRYTRTGAMQSAFIRVQHPHDYRYGYPDIPENWFKEVPFYKPWGRQQVIFLREQQRVDQSRAVSDLVSGMREIAIARKFRDVTLQKAVLAASYAATIESELPANVVYEQIGAAVQGDKQSEAVINYGTRFLEALNAYVGNSKNLLIDGVKIPHLFPGTKLHMQNVGDPAGVGTQFEQSLLRYAAAALNVSYEELARDYTRTNYSSARAAMAQTRKFMLARKRVCADRFATSIYRLWLEEAVQRDRLSTFRASEADSLYTDGMLGLMFDALSQCSWIGAARGQIDELKETQAAVLRLKNGLSTYEDELAAQGKDWRKVYAQLEREAQERKDREILLAPDDPNMMNATTGDPREPETDGTEDVDATDD